MTKKIEVRQIGETYRLPIEQLALRFWVNLVFCPFKNDRINRPQCIVYSFYLCLGYYKNIFLYLSLRRFIIAHLLILYIISVLNVSCY